MEQTSDVHGLSENDKVATEALHPRPFFRALDEAAPVDRLPQSAREP